MTTTAPAPVTRYYELVDAGDVEGLVGLFTEDATYERPGYEPMRGHAGLTAFYSGERIIESGAHTLTHAVVDGDEVAVQGRFEGRARDGRALELRFADFFRLDGERISYRTTYFYAPLA
ncbi:nuclear transport factor 2 family protein [Arsenicicoccus sp. oral taxon 190]|uniref:nuclear transport factor 2 family protein n=1 Tax=Arsenicicoccus sp. oral taxon 190 TaxID=1658671 RepID=UPI000679F751|nr:nuclear transport factor 2 family protein [Arsenicicoccus sp. oral taxon 190]AKT51099.1 ketosteroid isomerase [Arsenicicoccus sp. oral taxon 190]